MCVPVLTIDFAATDANEIMDFYFTSCHIDKTRDMLILILTLESILRKFPLRFKSDFYGPSK